MAMSDDEPVGPPSLELFTEWNLKAGEDIEEWGIQDVETLLLAMQEELGELTQAHLETIHEDGDQRRVANELDDLAALVLQLRWRLATEVDG